ncbi:MAG: hypothetical protein JNM07_15390, partial [Phycisphaerae bacterium]|nr:hypothetical protein [Phycisphaerae bacterium]
FDRVEHAAHLGADGRAAANKRVPAEVVAAVRAFWAGFGDLRPDEVSAAAAVLAAAQAGGLSRIGQLPGGDGAGGPMGGIAGNQSQRGIGIKRQGLLTDGQPRRRRFEDQSGRLGGEPQQFDGEAGGDRLGGADQQRHPADPAIGIDRQRQGPHAGGGGGERPVGADEADAAPDAGQFGRAARE